MAIATTNGERRTVTRGQIMSAAEAQEIRDHHWPALDPARGRAQASRDFLSKKTQPRMHKNFRLAGADSADFRPGLPQQMTAALKLRNLLASRMPALSRYTGGSGPTAEEIATNLEQWGEAGMQLIYPYSVTVDLLQNEGECGTLMRPASAGWQKRPDPKDPKFERDREGRKAGDPYFGSGKDFKLNLSKSSAAYERALNDHLARYFPVECEALSITECAPINPRWVGNQVKVDGLIRERTLTVSELLRRRWRWQDGQGRLIEPEYGSGSTTSMTLLETWLTDEDELPFVSYTVTDGVRAYETRKVNRDGNTLVDAQIDLSKQHGLTTLPIAWEYGWHWALADIGERSIPFILPFIEAFMCALNMLGGVVAHTHLTGFGGWALLRDPRNPVADINKPADEPIRVGPLEILELEGKDIKPLVHPGPSPMAGEIMKLLLSSIQEEGPPSGAFGGDASSGIDRTMMMRQVEHAVYDITNGIRRLFERSASNMLEVGCAIGMTADLDVPIYKNVEVPESGKRGERNMVVLHPDDTDEVYDYQATYPTKPGDNLALAAQLWNFYQGGGILEREWREWAFGDKHPEVFRAEKIVEQIERSPLGQADVIDYAARKIGDEKMAERIKAMAKGELFPDGTPAGMLAGLQGPPGGPGGAPGVQGPEQAAVAVPDPGQSAVAGYIGGALTASRAAASMPGPAGVAPGSGP